jgi:hypothetical protein
MRAPQSRSLRSLTLCMDQHQTELGVRQESAETPPRPGVAGRGGRHGAKRLDAGGGVRGRSHHRHRRPMASAAAAAGRPDRPGRPIATTSQPPRTSNRPPKGARRRRKPGRSRLRTPGGGADACRPAQPNPWRSDCRSRLHCHAWSRERKADAVLLCTQTTTAPQSASSTKSNHSAQPQNATGRLCERTAPAGYTCGAGYRTEAVLPAVPPSKEPHDHPRRPPLAAPSSAPPSPPSAPGTSTPATPTSPPLAATLWSRKFADASPA